MLEALSFIFILVKPGRIFKNLKFALDGSVLVAHGGIEMGQGLFTKMIQIASKELGVPMDKIHTLDTCSTVVPNAAPTAASVSSDHIGFAVKKACEELRERLSVRYLFENK